MSSKITGAAKTAEAAVSRARSSFHRALLERGTLSISSAGKPSIADQKNPTSVFLAASFIGRLKGELGALELKPQTGGKKLEIATKEFLEALISEVGTLLPGKFSVYRNKPISDFAQFAHLRVLEALASENRDIRIALGGDYFVSPDVVVGRAPLTDAEFNRTIRLVDGVTGKRATLREGSAEVLHASVSCKLTIRSDRSQNSRLEALNLIRNRRGRTPHITVVTAEPLPSRIASIAVGTGDFDCIYHVALDELYEASVEAARSAMTGDGRAEQLDKLELMIDSRRLKDISDLPLDLLL